MYSLFWKTLFTSLWFLILVTNIAFTFNVVNLVNPSSLDLDYSNYYFGMSSFIDSFTYFFGHNDFLNGFYQLITGLGNVVSKFYNFYKTLIDVIPKLFGWKPAVTEVITGVIALVLFATNAVPLLLMLLIGVLYFIYLAMFGLQIIFFVISFFGGSFATPLPSTEWFDTGVIANNLSAYMV